MKAGVSVRVRPRARGRGWSLGRVLGSSLALLMLGYLIWPYVVLWRLDRALTSDDRATLARLVDLPAVRAEIAHRLDKDANGRSETPSDAFIAWLEQGLRRDGVAVLERRVTLDWLRGLLPAQGMGPVVTRAFFDDPMHFSVRLGHRDRSPVSLRLRFDGLGWRVTAVHF